GPPLRDGAERARQPEARGRARREGPLRRQRDDRQPRGGAPEGAGGGGRGTARPPAQGVRADDDAPALERGRGGTAARGRPPRRGAGGTAAGGPPAPPAHGGQPGS